MAAAPNIYLVFCLMTISEDKLEPSISYSSEEVLSGFQPGSVVLQLGSAHHQPESRSGPERGRDRYKYRTGSPTRLTPPQQH
jgi:hypothetical protein